MPSRIFTVTPNPVLDRTLTVPEIILDDVLRATEVRLDAGGKGFNVSRALMAVGVKSTAMGFLGGDTGRMMAHMMEQRGIGTDFTAVAGETRTNIVIQEPSGRHIKVNEAGPVIAPGEVDALMARLKAVAETGDLWVFAGSLPRGVDADFYRRCVEIVQAHGARAVLDASGPALVGGLRARPWLAKPNALEAGQATGVEVSNVAEAVEAVRILNATGIGVVAVSLGADGLVAGNRGETWHAQPPEVRALNTVGAGDAAVAGMIWATAQAMPFGDVVRYGVAFGTAAVTHAGVDFGVMAEVEAIARAVHLRAIA